MVKKCPSIKVFPRKGKQLSTFSVTDALMSDSPRTKRPFQRICELMRKNGAETVVIQHSIKKEMWFSEYYKHVQEYLANVKRFARILDVAQVSFWSTLSGSINKETFPKGIKRDRFLGVCIVIKLQTKEQVGIYRKGDVLSFVFEAVTSLPNLVNSQRYSCRVEDFYHIFSSNEKVCVRGRELDIPYPCTYFCQSGGIFSFCTHANLRMGLHYSRDPLHRSYSYKAMNEAASKSTPAERSKPGYCVDEIASVLEDIGIALQPLWLNCTEFPEISPYEYAYSLVESRIPVLMVFSPFLNNNYENPQHVVFVIGHTINYHEWLPTAYSFYIDFDPFSLNAIERSYIPLSSWAPHLIVNDDLLGPCHFLRETDLIKIELENENVSLRSRIEHVIGLVPKERAFTVSPYFIQEVAAMTFRSNWHKYLEHVKEPWKSRLEQDDGPLRHAKKLVLRTRYITQEEYIEHLKQPEGHVSKSMLPKRYLRVLREQLPSEFWMAEFTCPEVFTLHSAKLGEVLLKFNPSEKEQKDFEDGKNTMCFGFRLINYLELESETGHKTSCELNYVTHSKLWGCK